MQLLGVKWWMWVLEFQTKTGEGWPHWHVLIDLESCPGGKLNLDRAWAIWRDRWGIGGLQLSPPGKLSSAEHAINYATKYLTKQPEGGYPVWVLKSKSKIRFVQGCRELGPLVGDESAEDEAREDEEAEGESREMRTLLERMSECGLSSRVWVECVDRSTGELLPLRLAGMLPSSVDEVLRVGEQSGLLVEVATDDLGRTSRRVCGTSYGDLLARLSGEYATADGSGCGEVKVDRSIWTRRADRIRRRRRVILGENRFARRAAWAESRESETVNARAVLADAYLMGNCADTVTPGNGDPSL